MIGDVAWHQHNPKLFGSVGDDKQLLFWDTSMDGSKPTTVVPEVSREEGGVMAGGGDGEEERGGGGGRSNVVLEMVGFHKREACRYGGGAGKRWFFR